MNIYELELKKKEWDNSERFYFYGDNVFKLSENKGIEDISLKNEHSWNMRKGGDIYLRVLEDREYSIMKKCLKEIIKLEKKYS